MTLKPSTIYQPSHAYSLPLSCTESVFQSNFLSILFLILFSVPRRSSLSTTTIKIMHILNGSVTSITYLESNCQQAIKFHIHVNSEISHLEFYPTEIMDMNKKLAKTVFTLPPFIMGKIGNNPNVQ